MSVPPHSGGASSIFHLESFESTPVDPAQTLGVQLSPPSHKTKPNASVHSTLAPPSAKSTIILPTESMGHWVKSAEIDFFS
jgi:hypothetical protein